MMRSLFSGVSGLKSHQTRMDVIGNNIANVNTAGYKYSRTTFADTLSQTLTGASRPTENIGGTNAKQIGLGVSVASIDQVMGDGSPQSTGKNTDLALSGNGFFVMKQGGALYYTRDGAFEFDENGDYVLPGTGLKVQGWNLKEGETEINTTGQVETVNVKIGKVLEAQETSYVDFSGNLNAATELTTTTSGGVTTGDTITTTATAYDTFGNSYNFVVLLEKTATSASTPGSSATTDPTTAGANGTNTWTAKVYAPGASAAAAPVGSASLVFNAYGQLKEDVSIDVKAETVNGSTSPVGFANASVPNFKINYKVGDVTQFYGSNTIHQGASDGYEAGTLKSVAFDTTGVVTGVYTNGVRRSEAQVAVAQFTNSAGLTRTSNSLFQESNNSGAANIKTGDALGVSFTPGALEMSNVDVANEFSEMIITQRGFQSNSKIITVGDEMLETVINMKR